jgi:hypothetical protein
MTGGVTLSARTRTRVLLGHDRTLLGRASGPREEKEHVLLGRAEKEEEKRPEMKILFFFFKNMNIINFCLFH